MCVCVFWAKKASLRVFRCGSYPSKSSSNGKKRSENVIGLDNFKDSDLADVPSSGTPFLFWAIMATSVVNAIIF